MGCGASSDARTTSAYQDWPPRVTPCAGASDPWFALPDGCAFSPARDPRLFNMSEVSNMSQIPAHRARIGKVVPSAGCHLNSATCRLSLQEKGVPSNLRAGRSLRRQVPGMGLHRPECNGACGCRTPCRCSSWTASLLFSNGAAYLPCLQEDSRALTHLHASSSVVCEGQLTAHLHSKVSLYASHLAREAFDVDPAPSS